ncbi:MAG: hypothetical protein HFI30_15175 [Lachnospiraceae bacterium]|jgi:hypothetical protein|nr:hypothetical protein [Lachnospiraceae bacterium]
MPGYRRVISYIYVYEKGERRGNCGFVKLEAREGEYRFTVQLKKGFQRQGSYKLYLYVPEKGDLEGIYLGELQQATSVLEWKGSIWQEDLHSLAHQAQGIVIEGPGKIRYAAQWEDTPVAVDSFHVYLAEGKKPEQVNPGKGGSTERIRQAESEAHRAKGEVHRAKGEVHRAIEEARQGESEEKGFQEKPADQEREFLRQPALVKDASATVPADLQPDHNESQEAWHENRSKEHAAGRDSQKAPEESRRRPEESLGALEPSLGTTEPFPEAPDHAERSSGALEPFPSVPERSLEEEEGKTVQEPEELSAMEMPAEEADPDIPDENAATERMDSRQQKWEYLIRHFPVQKLFQSQGPPMSCIRIGPRDLQRLPRENWVLGNNSFLFHGYYQFRHLLLCRQEENGEPVFYLGVPGVYNERERMMAELFGFGEFRRSRNMGNRNGNFGYWFRKLEEA